MIARSIVRRLLLRAATVITLAVVGVSVPIVGGAFSSAMAQNSDDMAAALDSYGHWVRRVPYGKVWVPDGLPPDWRPYEYGHWVYTDDWGWYWVSDDSEDDWGWVVYHYGRWAHDRRIGWFWVPGDEWAPAWVDWRYGGDDIGWAPLPPDDLIDAYDDQPDYWVFVPLRYIGEPRLRSYYVPRNRHAFLLRETHIINRPVQIEGRRLWVNPGLAPGYIAGRTHVTLHAYNVRPRVFGGTAGVQGAVTIRRGELGNKGAIKRIAPVTIQRSAVSIQPTVGAPPPKPLSKGEHGVLGSHPPKAAQGIAAPQHQQQQAPAGVPPHPPTARPGPAPLVTPVVPPKEKLEDRRVVHPPGANGPPAGSGGPPPRPKVVPPPPSTVHAPPPVVHAPPRPPVAHAPRPPAAHTPPAKPGEKPPPKPGEKPEPPK